MLVTSRLMGVAHSVHDCGPDGLEALVLARIAEELDPRNTQGNGSWSRGAG